MPTAAALPVPGLEALDDVGGHLQSSTQSDDRDEEADLLWRQQKTDEILRCLAGTTNGEKDEEEAVDLWHLRELALSRGGLLSPTLRRRAWPKLLGVDSHVLGGGGGGVATSHHRQKQNKTQQEQEQERQVRLPPSALSEIKRDVGRAAWDVEGHIKRSRADRDNERENRRTQRRAAGSNGNNNLGFPSKNYYGTRSGTSTPVTVGTITPQLVPEYTRAFPRYFAPRVPPSSAPNANGRMPPVKCVNFEPGLVGTVSPAMSPAVPYFPSSSSASNSTMVTGTTSSVASGTLSPPLPEYHGKGCSLVVAYHTFDAPANGAVMNGSNEQRREPPRRTRQEQDLLLNILNTVLRSNTELHYTSGLQDLASLLLINLESPSLTTLTLKRLSSHHLRDVMRPTLDELSACVRVAFLPLLSTLDPDLHRHLTTAGVGSDCPFAIGWIVSWFSHDTVPCLDVASRLIDFFLASHALMPVYMSVCVLCHPFNRERILRTPRGNLDALSAVLGRVPRDMVEMMLGPTNFGFDNGANASADAIEDARKADLMGVFEEVIEAAIATMREVPPPILLRKARKYQKGSLSPYAKAARSVTMFQRPPSWVSSPTAPTDWSLIRKAKAAREAAQCSLPMIPGSPSSPPQMRGRCWSSSSTPTSSPPGDLPKRKKFFASSSPLELSVPKFFFATSSSAPAISSTATSHRIALDASGLGATVDTADASLGRVWKAVAFLLAVTAALSYVPNSGAFRELSIIHNNDGDGDVQGGAEVIESETIARRQKRKRTKRRNIPSSALAVAPATNGTAHPTLVQDITSVVRLMSPPPRAEPENAFVYGASEEDSNVPTLMVTSPVVDDLVDLDTTQGEDSSAARLTPTSTKHEKASIASRLDRLGRVVQEAIPARFY